jgi:uncharacterized membrane protein YphA (DoxX/SURF4 family)
MEGASLVRITLGLVFAGSALAKLAGLRPFVASVRRYPFVPDRLAAAAALLLVGTEAVVASSLLLGVAVRPALLGAATLLVVFAAATTWTLHREGAIECACLGALVKLRLGWPMVAVNVALAVLAGIAAAASTTTLSLADRPVSVVVPIWGSALLLAATYWLAAYAQSVARLVDDAIARERAQ